ncbi:MAG TPA: hypothetical protein VJY41_15035 [Prolixibacteraceae bacterium]|nr:hypothetical protein [Prolixibacteraceae bacterium]
MNEIEKLTSEQFAEQTAAIYVNVFLEIGNLLNKHPKIDAGFEEDIEKLYDSSVKQMIQYGKVLAQKDEETREDFTTTSCIASWDALSKIDPIVALSTEKQLDERQLEFETYGSDNLERKFDELFAIMDFLDFEKIKEERPESAKEFGIL